MQPVPSSSTKYVLKPSFRFMQLLVSQVCLQPRVGAEALHKSSELRILAKFKISWYCSYDISCIQTIEGAAIVNKEATNDQYGKS